MIGFIKKLKIKKRERNSNWIWRILSKNLHDIRRKVAGKIVKKMMKKKNWKELEKDCKYKLLRKEVENK